MKSACLPLFSRCFSNLQYFLKTRPYKSNNKPLLARRRAAWRQQGNTVPDQQSWVSAVCTTILQLSRHWTAGITRAEKVPKVTHKFRQDLQTNTKHGAQPLEGSHPEEARARGREGCKDSYSSTRRSTLFLSLSRSRSPSLKKKKKHTKTIIKFYVPLWSFLQSLVEVMRR